MKKYLLNILILSYLFIIFSAVSVSAVEIKLLNSSEDELLFVISNIEFDFDYIAVNGKNYKRIIIPGETSTGSPGEPELPVISKLIGIPDNKTASVEILETDFFVVKDEDIAPVPQFVKFVNSDSIEELKYNYFIDKEAYSSDNYIPEDIAEISNIGTIRKQKIATLKIYPAQYNSLKKELKVYKQIKILVRFNEKQELEKVSSKNKISLKYFKETFKNLINYDNVVKWNAKKTSSIKKETDVKNIYSVKDFQYKIETEEDGLYKLTYDYLISEGISISEIDPKSIKIFHKDEEVSIYVSGEEDGIFDKSDYIIFYGTRNRGDSEFINPYTDRNVYWLNWDGVNGKRFEEYDGSIKNGVQADFFREKQHIEHDILYNVGEIDEEARITAMVPGEGWYWADFRTGSSLNFKFNVFGVMDAGNNPQIIVKFRGITPENHNLKLKMDNIDIGDIEFIGREYRLGEFTVGKGMIKEGENVLNISNTTPTEIRDVVYLDWIELDYNRKYIADNNRLSFSMAENDGTKYIITGFESEDAEIIDMTNQMKIINFQIEQAGSVFNVVFEDTRSGNVREYCTASGDGFLLPANMKKAAFSDLKNPLNSADYLIITHRNFMESASSLAEYRNNNNFQTKVIDVEHIYDEFNFGIIKPDAVKDFLKFAYDNWAKVPSFLVLFGDASWDFKKKSWLSRFESYVPSYGFPVSDNWFVCLDDVNEILPDMYLGRIPVASTEHAEKYIQKLIEYESGEPGFWNKRVLMINGGINTHEQNLFQESSNYIVNNITSVPPSAMRNTVINKTSTDLIDFSYRDEIINIIDEGVLWVNSSGHAAPQTYDVDFGRPSDLNNYKKYPFMMGMSCNTGKFASPSVFSLGEGYLLTGDKGAIGYFGTTGWGYIQLDNTLQESIFRSVFVDTVRMLGVFTTDAKYNLYREEGRSQEAVNLINQYILLGDPCTCLAFSKKPDLAIKTENIIFSNNFPNEVDAQVKILIKVENYGLYSQDSVRISLYDEYEGMGIFPIKENIVLKPIGIENSISVDWEVSQKKGNHNIIVKIDPEDLIDEVSKENNIAKRAITVFSTGVTLLKPPGFSRINTEKVQLEAFCYSQEASSPKTLYFEVDTSSTFDLPIYTSGPVEEQLVNTKVTVDLPYDRTVYYWRVRNFDGSSYSRWVKSIFYTDFSADSGFVWIQNNRMFEENLIDNLKIDGNLELAPRIIPISVESAGALDGNYAVLYLDNSLIKVTAYDTALSMQFYYQGFYTAVIDENSGALINAVHFNTQHFTEHSEAMADFINNVPENNIVLCGVVSDGYFHLTNPAKNALKSIGSALIDNLYFRDSYAVIGRKGAPQGTVPEQLKKRGTGRVVLQDSIITRFLNGNMTSQIIDGAREWQSLTSVTDVTQNGTDLKILILGFNSKMFRWDTLYTDISGGIECDLSGININEYSKLKLNAELSDNDGLNTPYLSEWALKYEPACDLSTNFRLVSIDKDSVMEGESVYISADIYNVGFSAADSVLVRFFAVTGEGKEKIGGDVVLFNILQNGSKTANAVLNITGYNGDIKILTEVDPDNAVSELSEFNNSALIDLFISEDNQSPTIEVSFDGSILVNGDYVSENPEIIIRIKDNNPSGIKDTSNVKIFLDNINISFYNNPAIQFIKKPAGSDILAEVIYKPLLKDGEHRLKVIVTDVGKNFDFYESDFKVSAKLQITRIYNFPNPLNEDTHFTYVLTKEANEVQIKIFTVSGRLIKVLGNISNKTGYNQVYWNGKDEEGDNPANGVYFYKIIAKSKEENISAQQKFVIMR